MAPGDPDSLYARAEALAKVGEPARAIENYSRVIEARPGHLAAYRGRAFARCRVGRIDGAVADHLKWVTSGPRFVETTEKALDRLGFDPGPVDGDLDAESREAMRRWVAAGCP